jgi:hypothetical protein
LRGPTYQLNYYDFNDFNRPNPNSLA